MRITSMIDHTLLKPEATEADILLICEEAKRYGTASVCVNGCRVAAVKKALAGTGIKTCVVVGFPLGAMTTAAKAFEAADAVRNGAEEVDMVINVGEAKAGNWSFVREDIAAVKAACGSALLKVIIEACLLTDEEKVLSCRAAEEAGADFVKTSTGFSKGGATAEDVALMRASVSPKVRVKAAGGIRTREDAERMIAAGADRIGASATAKIAGE